MRNDLISMLARADVHGRICADQDELLARIDLFEAFCREQGCWSEPYTFPSDHSRFEYFRSEARHHTYHAYDDTRCTVILMSGLPGAGKDTWISQHGPGWPVVSLDALREQMGISPEDKQGAVVDAAKEQARAYLREEQNFIWNATNTTYRLRQGLIGLFSDYGARVHIVYVEAPWDDLLRQNQQRDRPVPTDVLLKLADQLNVPDLTEAHQVAWLFH